MLNKIGSFRAKKQLLFYLLGVGIIFTFFIFLLSVNFIGFSAKEKCKIAQDKHKGDCVESLIQYLADEDNGFYSRNSAIWALGQFGDERALPILEYYFTGDIPDREPLDESISQYELKKAIGYMDGKVNVTTFFWKF